ncbi:hypothetical protein Zmor_000665 [Zophobas morio]|uniref:Uncharacterized protein n=1 Tax=Zophobas morio TaxID=2755281 RepID=A0AA38MRY1_9CUCU|nr:hypothetical protein Zmor_000665 [Zophobas morio]
MYTTNCTAIMNETIPGQLDWLLSTFTELHSPALDGDCCLNSHAILLETPPSQLLDFSGAHTRDFCFQALLHPPLPTMSHHGRTY